MPFETALFDSRWIPAAVRSRPKLMIVLHGQGDSLKAYENIRDELRLPDFNFLLLNAPRKYLNGFSWYGRHRDVRSVRARLFKLVRELKRAGWAPEDIFWLGHSQGALVVSDLVLNHPWAFGGIVGVSGYVWFPRGWRTRAARSGASRTPWLFTHGTRDRVILPGEIREDVRALCAGRLPVLYQEFAKGHDFDFRREVPFIRSWVRDTRRRRQQLLTSGAHA